MNSLLRKIIADTVRKNQPVVSEAEELSHYKMARAYRELKIIFVRWLKDFFLMTVGVFSAAFGLESFLLPNSFIDGGATGISLLISELSGVPLYYLLIVINIPFMILGYKILGSGFAAKTVIAITGLALVVAFVHFPNITKDPLLIAVFGGFFLGAGIGLSIRGGAVIDGTEILAIFLSRKLGTTIGDIIIIVNVLIFSAAAYFLSIEVALYSMITYLSASKTLDFIIEGIEEYTGVTIISSHNDEISHMISDKLGRGVTIYSGKSGYGKTGKSHDIDIVYSVVTRLELNKLNTEITKIDPNAFVVMSSIKDTKGGMVKKRPLKH